MESMQKGVSNSDVRAENKKRLTKLLFDKECLTKQELSSALSLSLPTVNLLVNQMEREGLVEKRSSTVSSGGRIPCLICFAYHAYFTIGMEISSDEIRLLLLTMNGHVVQERFHAVRFANTPEYWGHLRGSLTSLIEQSGVPAEKILGVGMAVPGIVNKKTDMLEFAPTLGLGNFSFHELGLTTYPLVVENEANAAGFYEVWTRPDIEDAVYLSVTQGVGGAIISKREIVHGRHFRSAEFGHMTLVPDGRTCFCGKKGCFEAYCSTQALFKNSGGELSLFFRDLSSNSGWQRIWDEYLYHLAVGISNIVMAMDLPVILGGSLTPHIERDFKRLKELVNALIPFSTGTQTLSISRAGDNSAAKGIAQIISAQFLGLI